MLKQLRQRNVHRVALAYLAGAWLLLQVVDTLTPEILPGAVFRITVLLAAIGFVPALILAWVFEWTAEGLRRERSVPDGAPVPKSLWLDRAIVVTLVLAVAYFATDKFVIDPVRDEEKIEAATAEAVEEALSGRPSDQHFDRSILVLPFLNIGADAEQDYFADGISEELLNLLAQIQELRVISRSTAWTFKGKDVDVAEVHRQLNVSHILEGSVRRDGNKVRVATQLIDARTNSHLWSDTYNRTLDDIFEIQSEISAEVVSALKLELLGGLPSTDDIDSRAYDLYLQGRYLTHTVREPEAFDLALELLSRAVELEPDYVPAIWELARAIWNASDQSTSPAVEQPRIRELVDRLVELAPDSSYSNGWLYWFALEEGDLQAAALYLERAVAGGRDANVYMQQSFAARMLADIGRFDEAEALSRYIVDRDPACTFCTATLGYVLGQSGRHREAAEELEALFAWREEVPAIHWEIGIAWLLSGDPAKALEHFEKIPPGAGGIPGHLVALHSLGRHDEFEAGFRAFRASSEADPAVIAMIAAWAGQNDLSFNYLERMVEAEGPRSARWVKTDLFNPIKSDRRWHAFLERNDASDDVWSRIRFDPRLPAEVETALSTRE